MARTPGHVRRIIPRIWQSSGVLLDRVADDQRDTLPGMGHRNINDSNAKIAARNRMLPQAPQEFARSKLRAQQYLAITRLTEASCGIAFGRYRFCRDQVS
jgi:hypothetical protein